MSELVERLRGHQKKAQRGISGYGDQLYQNANEFCAEIYADTGLGADRIESLQTENNDLRNALEALVELKEMKYAQTA